MNSIEEIIIIDPKGLEQCKLSNFGSFPNNRSLKDYISLGVIILDKHAGPTSHEIVATVKEILEIQKAGHAGTLDPGVTGVLPIALESATKILGHLLNTTKEYICNMRLHYLIEENKIIDVLKQFEDEIYQVPPLKSNVVKKLRTRIIYEIELLEIVEKEVLFRVKCQAGTYIRTLCEDIGRAFGNKGYMKELRRIKTGKFDEAQLHTLHNIFDAYYEFKESGSTQKLMEVIQPVENLVKDMPKIIVRDQAIDPVCHGAKLTLPGIIGHSIFFANQKVALMSSKEELIAVADTVVSSQYIDQHSKGVIAEPRSVFMKRGMYPKYIHH